MKRVLCPQLPKPGRSVELPETEAHHAVRVLRLRDGETVEAMDGQGRSALAILRVRGDEARLEVASGTPGPLAMGAKDAVLPLTLEMAVLKGDAMEWVVEKAVELGVRTLAPLLTDHTVVQVKGKGPEAFRDRWQKIADQALKQCGRLDRLEVLAPLPLDEALAARPASGAKPWLWADEGARGETEPLSAKLASLTATTEELRLLIGPEGGWSAHERELLERSGCTRVSLGPLVLRAETAALFAISVSAGALRAAQGLRASDVSLDKSAASKGK